MRSCLAVCQSQGDSSTGLPEDYATDYLVAASTLSPDRKFAIIYSKANYNDPPEGKDQVVCLQPFTILGALDTEWPYFKNESLGGLRAEWSKDGSVALVVTNAFITKPMLQGLGTRLMLTG